MGFVAVALSLALSLSAGTSISKPVQNIKATGMAARLEQMAYVMLPEEKMDRMMGFFGPVTKKYLPVFNQFQQEYVAAAQKLPVIVKYVPQAENAIADARVMKVPAKYEAEKAEYINMTESFLLMLKMSLKLGSH